MLTTEQQAVVNAAAIAILDFEAWLYNQPTKAHYRGRTADDIIRAYMGNEREQRRLLNAALDAAETVRGCKPTTQKRADRPSRRAA